MYKKKSTERLQSELKSVKNLERFIKENEESLVTKTVPEYLNELLIQYDVEKKDVIHRSGLIGSYGYQIFDGKRSAGREKMLQLAFGFPLTLEETQRLLRLSGYSELYVKKKREALIMYALGMQFDLYQTNDLLEKNEEETFK